MSNSNLVQYTKISQNHSGKRTKPIKYIPIHHVAGAATVESIARTFQPGGRRASSNYGIGVDGTIGMFLPEDYIPWTTSNQTIDSQGVTIEVANSSSGGNWPVSDHNIARLIELVTDICKRHGITDCSYYPEKSKRPLSVIQLHNWHEATACPGPYLESKMPYISQEVNKRLKTAAPSNPPTSGDLYRVQVGAYRERANADATEAKLKAAGYPTYLVETGGLYKVQTGAFADKANADNLAAELKGKGFDVYITTENGTAAVPTTLALRVGDSVKVKAGADDYNGNSLASFVYQTTYTVQELDGSRAVIGIDGRVTAAIDVSNLIKL